MSSLVTSNMLHFTVIVGAIHIPKGEGKKRITKLTGPDNSIYDKKSMVEIVNSDKICMARAIGVCFANLCVIPRDEWLTTKETTGLLSNVEILLTRRRVSTHP